MAQSLEVNIKTTSDVPQAMDKAKTATASFGKQVEDIQKKFSTAFKDVALGFIAPMVIVQQVISTISSLIQEAKQLAQDGIGIISKGESQFSTMEEAKMAQFFKTREALEKEAAAVEAGRRKMTLDFLNKTEAGQALLKQERAKLGLEDVLEPGVMAMVPEFQKIALDAFLNSEEGRKFKPIFEDKKAASDTGTGSMLGAGVIGVGSSPQIALAMEANTTLSSIDSKLGELVNAGIDKDPTKPLNRKFPLYSPGLQR
jgi:hypothetical protein